MCKIYLLHIFFGITYHERNQSGESPWQCVPRLINEASVVLADVSIDLGQDPGHALLGGEGSHVASHVCPHPARVDCHSLTSVLGEVKAQ